MELSRQSGEFRKYASLQYLEIFWRVCGGFQESAAIGKCRNLARPVAIRVIINIPTHIHQHIRVYAYTQQHQQRFIGRNYWMRWSHILLAGLGDN